MGTLRWLAGVVAVAFVASACAGTPSPTVSPSPSIEQTSPTPTAKAATPSPVAPTPTPVPPLAIDELPRVELADVDATAVCDPEPSQANLDAGESTIYCSDGLALAVAVVRTVTQDPVIRLYLHRPTCASVPCSEDDLSTAEVTIWTGSLVLSVQLDSRLESVPQPVVSSNDVWPAPGSEPEPPVSRPSIQGAPRAVADRDPYPFCGRAEMYEPPDVLGCFRDAVLTGRKAEMINRVYGTEGGEILWIYRYDGVGRLLRYQQDGSNWGTHEGAMILGITPQTWDFDPWWGTDRRL